jgi:hypothetical protein
MAGINYNKRLQQSKGRDGYNYAKVDDNGAMLTAPQQGMTDAFGRLRVSQVNTFLDLKQTHDKLPLFFDEVLNGDATSTHSVATASTNMATTTSGDYAIRQTKQRANYQSGKGQQIFITFGGFQPQTNIEKRVGYFTSSTDAPYNTTLDGIVLESKDGVVTLYTYRNGEVTNQAEQSEWDDAMNGDGASGVAVDWSKTQIALISFEWLGVGSVQFSLVVDGIIYDIHKFKNANNLEDVYMSSPNKPIRYEIRQTGAGSGSFKTICATVGSEGAINTIGKILSTNTGVAVVDANATANTYALIGVRLQDGKEDTEIDIIDFNIYVDTSTDILWKVILNPTVAGTFVYSNLANANVQVAYGDTVNDPSGSTVTGGILLASGYIKSGGGATAGSSRDIEIVNALRLGRTIAGVQDAIVLCAQPLDVNADLGASITFRERN